jgi:hypothetical protein
MANEMGRHKVRIMIMGDMTYQPASLESAELLTRGV